MNLARVIEEEYVGSPVRAVTTLAADHITYEVFHGEVLRWSRMLYNRADQDTRERVAREQDAYATALAKESSDARRA